MAAGSDTVAAWRRLGQPDNLAKRSVFLASFRHIEKLVRNRTGQAVRLSDAVIAASQADFLAALGEGLRKTDTTETDEALLPGAFSPILIGSLVLSAFARKLGRPIPGRSRFERTDHPGARSNWFGRDGFTIDEVVASYYSVELMLCLSYRLRGIVYIPELDQPAVVMAEFVMERVARGGDVREAFSHAFSYLP